MRTSANVYLTALAVGDSLVLVVASVAFYPGIAWGFWLEDTSVWACRTIKPLHNTLLTASVWIIPAFTAERCVAIRLPLPQRRVCTPSNAGLCCVALLVAAFVKNADFVFMSVFTTNSSVDINCFIPLSYWEYVYEYRAWINIVLNAALPLCAIIACNWAIIRQLRCRLMPAAVRDSLTRTTLMCLGVSFAFIVCDDLECIFRYRALLSNEVTVLGRCERLSRHQLLPVQSYGCSLPERVDRFVSQLHPARTCDGGGGCCSSSQAAIS